MPKKPLISIVDDDDSVSEGTMDLFKAMGLAAEAFPSAADFLKSNYLLPTADCGRADARTGLELYDRLIESGHAVPDDLDYGLSG